MQKTKTIDKTIFILISLTFLVLPVRTAFPLITISLCIILWLFSGKFLQATAIIHKKWFYPVILFVVLPWVGLIYSKNLELGFDYALKTKYWILAFLTASVFLNEKRVLYIIYCLWTGLAIGALLQLLQLFGVVKAFHPRFAGFGMVYTLLSMYLIVGITTASYVFKTSEGVRTKILTILLIVLFIFQLAFLEGRSGYFVFIIISPLIANNLMYKFSFKLKLVVVILLISALFLSPVFQKRVEWTISKLKQRDTIVNGEWDPKFERPYIFRSAIGLFLKHPWKGIGTGSLHYYTQKKGKTIDHPHNNILYMGVSFGVVGIISYFWLMGMMFYKAWMKKTTLLGNFILYIGLVIFLGGLFDTSIINNGTSLLLPLGYGMLNHIKPAN